ncbi:hypothetical protein Dda_3038 [Drechslerella dactyloides]|uniref:Uncharacterized protein n=1 Tax=Drechslerella dactyloides TaxID=74499 RepID=A0AAD6J0Q4_DREDA|nr:hypothetical protein Dda_3038 [Drechslerella dactyloides]
MGERRESAGGKCWALGWRSGGSAVVQGRALKRLQREASDLLGACWNVECDAGGLMVQQVDHRGQVGRSERWKGAQQKGFFQIPGEQSEGVVGR